MVQTMFSKTIVAACLLAASAAGACSDDNRSTDTTDPANERVASAPHGHEGAPMTVTGCLQKGDDSYIITQVNSPSGEPVGTSGSARQGDAVSREQLRAAKHAYALEGGDDDLAPLVGKHVRVVGMMAEASELRAPGARADARPTSESRQDPSAHHDKDSTAAAPSVRERVEIEEGDLAQIDVTSVEQLAEVCGESHR
jgi:hypothetical protein